MFLKMQIKLTILYTIMLMSIMLVTNAAVYLLLTSYNNAQLIAETERMLVNISSDEWIQEPAVKTPTIINGVHEEEDRNDANEFNSDSELNNSDNEINKDSNETIKKAEEIDELDDGDTEDKPKEENTDDKTTEDKPEDKSIEDKSIEDKQEDKSDEDSPDSGYIINTKISFMSTTKRQSPIKKLIKRDSIISQEDSEVVLSENKEILIPAILDEFSFYFIYSNEDVLLKWRSDFDQLNEKIIKNSEKLVISEQPKLIIISDEEDKYFLMQKLPIVVKDNTIGYYIIGRDVSIANLTMNNLLRILIISLIAGLVLSILLGYIIAGKTIKPIKEGYLSKQKFLADASHELRTPISVVMLSCNALEEEDAIKDPFSKQVIEDIKGEALLMKDLVERLLSLARYDTGKVIMNKEKVNITQLLESNIKSYRYLAQDKRISIEESIAEGLFVNGDLRLLNSMISIFMDNAIKYNRDEGSIRVKGDMHWIKRKDFVKIEIIDSGNGISANDIKEIFERFYRVDKSRHKDTKGHGLGLSIAKEVIELHKGHVSVNSEIGKGTIFTIEIPALKSI